jgi:hypothetical protein
VRPFRVKSVGLTVNPALPVHPEQRTSSGRPVRLVPRAEASKHEQTLRWLFESPHRRGRAAWSLRRRDFSIPRMADSSKKSAPGWLNRI